MENLGTATYSPEDNKLRLYSFARLGKEDYERFKAAGFKWAPRQELFVAPMWTPGRADLLTETCGDIGDEDTSLVDRAEDRAERFDGYSDKRSADAQAASDGVKAITDGIPFGQPILVGHHSERHARRDAQRIESGMRKTIKMWETSEYWTRRAAGALHHAKYKERPDVRQRRIKKLEATKRKEQKYIKEATALKALWSAPDLDMKKATAIANYDHGSYSFPLCDYPRDPPASQYEGPMGLWSALDGTQEKECPIVLSEIMLRYCFYWCLRRNSNPHGPKPNRF